MHSYLYKVPMCFVLSFAFILGTDQTANADLINIASQTNHSTDGLGEFTGTLQYDYQIGDMGRLTVFLNNTSDLANGGWITGLIFNFATSDDSATANLAISTHPFDNAPWQDGAPYGASFIGGAALGGEWNGGGSGFPELGIGVGESGSFVFNITAIDAVALTAGSFLEGPFDFNFLVRFQGFNDKGSDKVPAVPAPGALVLLGLGALAHRGRRRPLS